LERCTRCRAFRFLCRRSKKLVTGPFPVERACTCRLPVSRDELDTTVEVDSASVSRRPRECAPLGLEHIVAADVIGTAARLRIARLPDVRAATYRAGRAGTTIGCPFLRAVGVERIAEVWRETMR